MSAARHEVLSARSEPGADPEVVDRVLRQLDVRSLRCSRSSAPADARRAAVAFDHVVREG
jgi:hypothetical protein